MEPAATKAMIWRPSLYQPAVTSAFENRTRHLRAMIAVDGEIRRRESRRARAGHQGVGALFSDIVTTLVDQATAGSAGLQEEHDLLGILNHAEARHVPVIDLRRKQT